MKISFDNQDKVNGLMTLSVEAADYEEKVEKQLKEYRKKAKVPGFRPGMVPMGLIKRQYGTAAKLDEVNKLIGEAIYNYVKENNIQMLGEPLPSDKQVPQDLEGDGPFEFVFDIAVAPDFKIELTSKDKVDYFEIDVDDKLVDQQIEMYAARGGRYENVDEYDAEKRDRIQGDLRELDADGNTKEGGVTVADVSMMPQYIKVEDQKSLFDGAKPGDIITFNPRKAYPDNDAEIAALLKMKKEEVADITADFSYQVTGISRYVNAPVNQQLFDQVFGEGNVTSEEEFRTKVADDLKVRFASESDYLFMLNARKYCEEKVGELTFPEEILKRVMKANNKDKGDEYVEKNFEGSIKELKWHLIKEQLVAAAGIKIDDADVKSMALQMARAQFAQYGMTNLPDDYLENYANEMLKKRENVDSIVNNAIDRKLTVALKDIVKLNKKTVSLEEFNKMAAQ
jgi:trigger factor